MDAKRVKELLWLMPEGSDLLLGMTPEIVEAVVAAGGKREATVYGGPKPYVIVTAEVSVGNYPARRTVRSQYSRPATEAEIAALSTPDVRCDDRRLVFAKVAA